MDYDEGPDEEWIEDDGEPEDDVLACPSCHEAVHEDTQQCPYCSDWIIPVEPHGRSKRLMATVVVVLIIVALVLLTIR
jgi:predicted nucleic acid-binding Zn ribbon protein